MHYVCTACATCLGVKCQGDVICRSGQVAVYLDIPAGLEVCSPCFCPHQGPVAAFLADTWGPEAVNGNYFLQPYVSVIVLLLLSFYGGGGGGGAPALSDNPQGDHCKLKSAV